jgi:tetratricopeptide (TPR) repeat protein
MHKAQFSIFALALILAASAIPAAAPKALEATEDGKTPPQPEITDSNSLLGSYLAGRVARSLRDADNAVIYYQRALEKDPANEAIVEDAFQLELASGNFGDAKGFAKQIMKREKGQRIAQIFLGLDAFKHKEYKKADAHFIQAERSSPGEPTVALARAWVALAQKKPQKAFALLQAVNKVDWAEHFARVHRAFIADLAKRKDTAEEIFAKLYAKQSGNARIAEAYARHLAYWGDNAKAIEVLKGKGADQTAMGKALLAELEAGKKPKLLAASVEEGMAEVFLGIGQILVSNNGVDAAQVYMRLALFVDPSSDIAKLELSEVYAAIGKYEKAIEIIDNIPEDSPLALNVEIRKASHLNALKRVDEAAALLKRLAGEHPDNDQIPEALASLESGRKNYEAAIPYYSRAIDKLDTPDKKDWTLFYARGIAYERSKQWPKAEADFKKALDLDPDQSAVLNYLGYSWLDHGVHVHEALDLIKKAVKLRPNDGYIIDSLGWAYYMLGDYPAALKNLERAVELRPEDPTLNDHLGDIYWRVGRKLEAQFQWSQALTLDPEPDAAAKIKRKVETGQLDEPAHLQASAKPEEPHKVKAEAGGEDENSKAAGK